MKQRGGTGDADEDKGRGVYGDDEEDEDGEELVATLLVSTPNTGQCKVRVPLLHNASMPAHELGAVWRVRLSDTKRVATYAYSHARPLLFSHTPDKQIVFRGETSLKLIFGVRPFVAVRGGRTGTPFSWVDPTARCRSGPGYIARTPSARQSGSGLPCPSSSRRRAPPPFSSQPTRSNVSSEISLLSPGARRTRVVDTRIRCRLDHLY